MLANGITVSPAAQKVANQEKKYKLFRTQLSFLVEEYDRVVLSIIPVARPLVEPLLESVLELLEPALHSFTWEGANIDGFCHQIHSALVGHAYLIAFFLLRDQWLKPLNTFAPSPDRRHSRPVPRKCVIFTWSMLFNLWMNCRLWR